MEPLIANWSLNSLPVYIVLACTKQFTVLGLSKRSFVLLAYMQSTKVMILYEIRVRQVVAAAFAGVGL